MGAGHGPGAVGQPDPKTPEARARKLKKLRGWRSFTTVAVKDATVVIEAGGLRCEVTADRGGFIDSVVQADLPPGWQTVRIRAEGSEPVDTPVRIIDPKVRLGIVSDIDDTVMVTALPRPLLAAWNTFVLDEHARAAVPGMAVLYERLVTAHPGTPVFYLSTGAWNVAPTLTRFLSRHLYPAGPLLLTDWGPQKDRWFRSGQDHKRATLRRLADGVPRHAVAADRRRRPARPRALRGVRAPRTRRTSRPWRSGACRRPRRSWPARCRRTTPGPLGCVGRSAVAVGARRRRAREATDRVRRALTVDRSP